MWGGGGVTNFVLEGTCPEKQLNLSKSGFVSEEDQSGCKSQTIAIRFFHQSHNTVHFGGLFTLKQWIFSSLKHGTVPRENKLYCFYVKSPPKRIALWDRENSQYELCREVFSATYGLNGPIKRI